MEGLVEVGLFSEEFLGLLLEFLQLGFWLGPLAGRLVCLSGVFLFLSLEKLFEFQKLVLELLHLLQNL